MGGCVCAARVSEQTLMIRNMLFYLYVACVSVRVCVCLRNDDGDEHRSVLTHTEARF